MRLLQKNQCKILNLSKQFFKYEYFTKHDKPFFLKMLGNNAYFDQGSILKCYY